MVALPPLVSEFNIVGRLEDLVISSKGRIKYLSVSTPEGDYLIDIAKSSNSDLAQYLQPGCHVKITGMQKYKLHQEQTQYIAYRIELLPEQFSNEKAAITNRNQRKEKILVCQGSSCCKKGSQAICQLLQTELEAQGMTDKIEIQTTGCMKRCKKAPFLIMPGRNNYGRVQPKQIPELIAKHLLT